MRPPETPVRLYFVSEEHQPAKRGTEISILEVEDVSKRYRDVQALHQVTLRVEYGGIVGLLGANGAGKSTLMSICAGVRDADNGRVAVNGIDVSVARDQAQRHLGYAPQELGIYLTLTVWQNMRFFAELTGLRGRKLTTAIDEISTGLGLSDLHRRTAATLSGGEKRRLHTAVALFGSPSLLILDEPTVGADVATRQYLLDLVKQKATNGVAVLYSTHYTAEIEYLEANVAILDHGSLSIEGTLSEVIDRHGFTELRLTFDGPAPRIAGATSTHDLSEIRLPVTQPEAAIGPLVTSLGAHALRLRNLSIVRPKLEDVVASVIARDRQDKR